jgi:Ser/Thr protein kinase RdoA (MazF antagonist)
MRPIARRHGLTMLQLACAWNLAQAPVRCVAPTLVQEPGHGAKPIEAKRAELAALPSRSPLSREEVQAIRAIGENTGCMALKGANPAHEGPARADRWALDGDLEDVAARWGIDPVRDLRCAA